MKLFKKYIFFSFLTRFFILLFFFFAFYLLIDFSLNAKSTLRSDISFLQIISYYSFEIALKLEILVPLCFLFSLVQTLFRLNNNLELVAFQSCGLSLQQLLKPIYSFSWFLTFFLLLNTQVTIPKFQSLIVDIKKPKKQKKIDSGIYHQKAHDLYDIIYSDYHYDTQKFIDVFFFKNQSEIYHCEELEYFEGKMRGIDVDIFQKNTDGILFLVERKKILSFPELHVLSHTVKKDNITLEFLSFTQLLFHQLQNNQKQSLSYNQAQSKFWYKLFIPFFSPLLFLLFSKKCCYYSRQKKPYKLLAVSLGVFVLIFTLCNALSILSERQILPAFIASISPFMILGIPGVYFYKKS